MKNKIPLNPPLRKGGQINKVTFFKSPFVKEGVRRTGDFGFTLIETVVVVSVLAVIIVTITSLLANSFKSRSKINLADTLEQNGSYILSQITNDFLNSDGGNAVCAVDGKSLALVSRQDGGTTVIQCIDGANIASNSAHPASLTQGVTVTNCAQFVSCDLGTDGKVSAINISFTLSAGVTGAGAENGGSRSFQTKVAARN